MLDRIHCLASTSAYRKRLLELDKDGHDALCLFDAIEKKCALLQLELNLALAAAQASLGSPVSLPDLRAKLRTSGR